MPPSHSRPAHKLPIQRFSNRVDNYIRYRPSYPQEVLLLLQAETGLTSDCKIADIGSGTGISSQLFLQNNNVVFGVEPNLEMRQASKRLLQTYPRFHSVEGTAESTTLASHAVDYAIAAQSFHWFHPQQAQAEFARILKPNGWVVLMWNARCKTSTPFLKEYEALLQQYGTDYGEIRRRHPKIKALKLFFAASSFELRQFANEQRFDFAGLKGRLLSSSYTPTEGHANFQPMLQELERIFAAYQNDGLVRFEYDTQVYFGRLAG
ncbi:MAG: methyltransferase domain-containing protein [Phormidesmis sp. RL_2_1]|nr:methyltransferase domain-containing protein [Phormidesmis sp. RL_2_1]